MVKYLVAYGVSVVVFLGIDALWLGVIAKDMFQRHMGDLLAPQPRLGVAAGFYALYVVEIVYFAVQPALERDSLSLALVNGVLLGLLAYGTYELTALAVIRGWSAPMAAYDIAWGAALTGGTAVIGFLAARWYSGEG
ncbi:MAG: DUF2177 family protein [Geminicoccaceae bacterium]|nr:DUF2177 family protein [Geminicoccaceae bacterium]